MYDKANCLRIELTINDPREFKVFRDVHHKDGTVTYYLSAEETPEYKAKVEADHKAKREKEAAQRKESLERSQEAADERRRLMEEVSKRRSIESALYSQMFNNRNFAYADSPEKTIEAYAVNVSSSIPQIQFDV